MPFIILPQPGKLGKEGRVYPGKVEGALPLRNLTFPSLRDRFERELKRGEASLIKLIPLPLIKGKGIKGIGLINNLTRKG